MHKKPMSKIFNYKENYIIRNTKKKNHKVEICFMILLLLLLSIHQMCDKKVIYLADPNLRIDRFDKC